MCRLQRKRPNESDNYSCWTPGAARLFVDLLSALPEPVLGVTSITMTCCFPSKIIMIFFGLTLNRAAMLMFVRLEVIYDFSGDQ
jgi:hypothetical protein